MFRQTMHVLSAEEHRRVAAYFALLVKVDKRANKRNAAPRSKRATKGRQKENKTKGPQGLSHVSNHYKTFKGNPKPLVFIQNLFIFMPCIPQTFKTGYSHDRHDSSYLNQR